MYRRFTLGFSPCPNDTFIFDALIHHKIDTEGLSFDVLMEDVEALNQKAFKGELDITKLSYAAYASLTDEYVLSDAGSALGNGVGPLLVSAKPVTMADINKGSTIAIPGKYTTANFLFSLAFPEAQNKKEMLFSDIESAVLDGSVDAGLLIHENRFTYQDRGLFKVVDLGDYWEKLTNAPIPLGGIVMKRTLPADVLDSINRLIRRSVEFAFAYPKSSLEFVKANAQEMSEDVMYKHIELYVNKYSIDLGYEGRTAVKALFEKAQKVGVASEIKNKIFLT